MVEARQIHSVTVSSDARETERQEDEKHRKEAVIARRLYYAGEQYEKDNENAFVAAGCKPGEHLPEHLRKHAYSTQIAECIDFLADRLGEGFTIKAAAQPVQTMIDELIEATETIAALDDDGNVVVVTDDLLREAFQTGDVPVYVGWDPIERRVFWEFWECEVVEFVQETTTKVEKVVRSEEVWREDPEAPRDENGDMMLRKVMEKHVYELQPNEFGENECVHETWWDEEDSYRDKEWLGIGVLPWFMLRADSKNLRVTRGESLITTQVMGTADRYNAVEQVGFLIARYNSHANLAVIGDASSLRLDADQRVHKDVADILKFPGGTAVTVLSLPTDPKMIEHQKAVLSDALYAGFGLVRVDQETISGLGGISGYALEILNQKTEATFKRVKRRWRKDVLSGLSLSLDVHAWKSAEPDLPELDEDASFEEFMAAEQATSVFAWWEIDPKTVYANRQVEIRMGSGYIVDDVMVRDDFVAGLISLEEALRLRGYDDVAIGKIVKEIEDAKPDLPEMGAFGVTPPKKATNGTMAGSTVGSTERKE